MQSSRDSDLWPDQPDGRLAFWELRRLRASGRGGEVEKIGSKKAETKIWYGRTAVEK